MLNWGARARMRPISPPCNHGPTIELLVSLIAAHFHSLQTINLLARTNKALSAALVSDSSLVRCVVAKYPAMSKTMLRRLFVMPQRSPIPFMTWEDSRHLSIYRRYEHPRCNPLVAFDLAMELHETLQTMTKAFGVRKVKSDAMKKVWDDKNEAQADEYRTRSIELTSIKQELQIISQIRHMPSTAALVYASWGRVEPLSAVYRDKMLMQYRTGDQPNGPEATFFQEIARKDMAVPRIMTHDEKLFILKHSIAWQHYLFNYSNYKDLLWSVRGAALGNNHIEFLIPLQNPWPWVGRDSPYIAGTFHVDELGGMWERWRALHDTLHPGAPGVLVLD